MSADPLAGRATTPLRRWFSTPGARGLLAVTVLASVALLGMRWKSGVSSASAEPITVAVLPLEDWSAGSAHAALSDGITEELNMQLSRMDPARLKVCPRAATQPYRRTTKTVADVAGELHANYLLAGDLRGDARRVRVTLELIRVRDRARVWGDEFDRDVGDPLALETELAAAVTARLKAGAFADGATRH